MLFNIKNRRRPRPFVYIPRYYNPENEPRDEDRFNFNQYRKYGKNSKRKGYRNPSLLILLAVLIAVIMHQLRPREASIETSKDLELTPSDVPALSDTSRPAMRDSAKTDSLFIHPHRTSGQ